MNACPDPAMLVAFGEGVLPEATELSVGAHLAECRVCAGLREDLRESPLAEPTMAELERLRRRSRIPSTGRTRRYAIGAIAAAASIAGVYLWSQPQAPVKTPVAAVASQPVPVFKLEVKPAPLRLPLAALVLRGQPAPPGEEYLKQLGQALEPYRAGQYQEGAKRLRSLAREHPRAVEPPFYEGVALLLTGDAVAALPRLEAARAIGGEALDDDIDWYLAAARERNGNWEQASPILRKLCSSDGLYRDGACRALETR